MLLILGLLGLHQNAFGQEEPRGRRLQVAGVDRSGFPEFGVNLILTDAQSQPLNNLEGLRLWENGVPIADFDVREVTSGVDLIFVIDGDERALRVEDDSGLTRLQKIRDSVLFYSGRFMDVAGRDHVSVIVPGDEGGRVLLRDVTEPDQLIQAMREYDPQELESSAIVGMLEKGLELLDASASAGRFQAIVLFTDATQLNPLLVTPIVEKAQVLQVPIFVLLLGSGQNEDGVEKVSSLTIPTRGQHAFMPEASESSQVFQVVQENGAQVQLRYQTNLTASGVYPIKVALENVQDQAALDLSVAAPEVEIALLETTVRRTGTQPDTPLEELQPSVQPVSVTVGWPDGMSRQLQSVSLWADGVPQEAPIFGGGESFQFEWDIRDLQAGEYFLTARVTDTLGLSAESEPVAIAIEVARPQPLPTAPATSTPQPVSLLEPLTSLPGVSREAAESFVSNRLVGILALLLVFVLFLSRRYQGTGSSRVEERQPAIPPESDERVQDEGNPVPIFTILLEPVEATGESIAIESGNVTLGRNAEHVDVAVDDKSISALHARIRRRGDTYWLYDEGSENGTRLNFERLGLAPKPLNDGDEIQLGRVRLRFRLLRSNAIPHVGRDSPSDQTTTA